MGAKENKPIVEYLGGAKALVLDPNSSSRATIRRLLSAVGMKTSNVEAMELIGDALAKLDTLQPNIILTELDLGDGRTAFELLAAHRKKFPDTLDSVFLLLTSNNSPIITSMAAESDSDGLIIKPFTYGSLEDRFIEVVKTKVFPSKYAKSCEDGRLKLLAKKYPDAMKLFELALTQDPNPALARYYIGCVHKDQGAIDEAIAQFEKGIAANPTHYKCLMGLFEAFVQKKEFSKAYDIGAVISKNHPLPPSRIPEFVKVAVLNQQFEDVKALYDVVAIMSPVDDVLVTYISAALVVCAKFYLRKKENDKAIEILKKAQSLARNKTQIQVEIISSLIHVGLYAEAEKMMASIPDELKSSSEMMALEIERWVGMGKVGEALAAGLKMLDQGVKNFRLLELLIVESKKMNRTTASVTAIVSKASALIPEKQAYFEGLVAGYEPKEEGNKQE